MKRPLKESADKIREKSFSKKYFKTFTYGKQSKRPLRFYGGAIFLLKDVCHLNFIGELLFGKPITFFHYDHYFSSFTNSGLNFKLTIDGGSSLPHVGEPARTVHLIQLKALPIVYDS